MDLCCLILRSYGVFWFFLLCSIHDPTESMATVDEVEVFHAALSSHLVSSVGLRVAALAIKRIDMPIIKMESSGKVRMTIIP